MIEGKFTLRADKFRLAKFAEVRNAADNIKIRTDIRSLYKYRNRSIYADVKRTMENKARAALDEEFKSKIGISAGISTQMAFEGPCDNIAGLNRQFRDNLNVLSPYVREVSFTENGKQFLVSLPPRNFAKDFRPGYVIVREINGESMMNTFTKEEIQTIVTTSKALPALGFLSCQLHKRKMPSQWICDLAKEFP